MSTANTVPIVSRECPDGTLLETIYDPEAATTAFAVGDPDGSVRIAAHHELPDGTQLVPYSPKNNLLTSGCVLLPSNLGEAGGTREVLEAIRAYLERYVDLSPSFLDLAPYYVLLTWGYDAFRELPYLRFRGAHGSGKTRSLLTLGSICYKPFFASGASTVSPIFHILDTFRGTLVLDEADFRFSDMTGELTKVLNNGTVDGLPVLRTMSNRHRELNPQAFRVYGPKLIAMRESFSDHALESRFISEEMGPRILSPHIPIHTPDALRIEACELRNRLLTWRLRNRPEIGPDPAAHLPGASPRANQMALALLSLVEDRTTRQRIATYLLGQDDRQRRALLDTTEAYAVRALVEAFTAADRPIIRLAEVAERFNQIASERFYVPLSIKAVGVIVREKLGITTAKHHGVYGIEQEERERVRALADRFGVPHSLARRPLDAMTETATVADSPSCSDAADWRIWEERQRINLTSSFSCTITICSSRSARRADLLNLT